MYGTSEAPIAKVIDFGISQVVGDHRNFLRGSLRHYPPESCKEKVNNYYTLKSDVFMVR